MFCAAKIYPHSCVKSTLGYQSLYDLNTSVSDGLFNVNVDQTKMCLHVKDGPP